MSGSELDRATEDARHRYHVPVDDAGQLAATGESPADAADQADTTSWIIQTIQEWPQERDRMIIMLLLSGQSRRAVGAQLGVSGSRISQIVTRLVQVLTDEYAGTRPALQRGVAQLG